MTSQPDVEGALDFATFIQMSQHMNVKNVSYISVTSLLDISLPLKYSKVNY
jgi:hypothetical protein